MSYRGDLSKYDPDKFIHEVDVSDFIKPVVIHRSAKVDMMRDACLLCKASSGAGIELNNGENLCSACAHEMSFVRYPQPHEKKYREYLVYSAARNKAFRRLRQEREYDFSIFENPFYALALGSLLIVGLINELIFLSFLLLITGILISIFQYIKYRSWIELKNSYNKKYPKPKFFDSGDIFVKNFRKNKKDKLVNYILRYWPKYPPYWEELKKYVKDRDSHRCQVTGCISIERLHIHHKRPLSKRGSHDPDNLITLCAFHHAVQPGRGHGLIRDEINTNRFRFKRGHRNKQAYTIGYNELHKYIVRKDIISMGQLKKVFKYYDLRCAKCGSKEFRLSLNSKVNIKCVPCSWGLVCNRRLPEETGPQVASALSVGRNRGLWRYPKDTGMIDSSQDEDSERREVRAPKKKSKIRSAEPSPQCPFCGSTVMVLDKPREGGKSTSSWRCSMPGCLGVVKQD